MDLSGNTVLITGGASGIGLALTERFINAGSEVIIAGRREDKLREAKARFPGIHTRVCDVSDERDRLSLFNWVKNHFHDFNILVNNAGIQQRINLLNAANSWSYYNNEIAINLDAPIHLSLLFAPVLLKRKSAAIINISSGLALAPGVWVPVYSATKAALHSFTVSLRLQLEKNGIRVFEVFPPAVNTDLGGVGLHTFGVNVDAFADAVFYGLEKGDLEIGYAGTEKRLQASPEELYQGTKQSWEGFIKNNPEFLDK
ncbi:MAG: SDR family NAD(P)-dependent oxidoreductase [Bacillota bacterium]|nr:SDR family NAD(P)-dependent oxidoreductase [Bacillota bacterium]